MKALRQAFQQTGGYTRDGYYIFLLDEALADQEPDAQYAAAGDMPRGKQFGYIFMQHAGDLSRTIAHELGHGIFTLQHSFDNNYSGPDYKGKTTNLMDYADGTELAVWQWRVMANPAPLTWFDTDEDGMVIVNRIDPEYRAKYLQIVEQLKQFDIFEKNYNRVEESTEYFVTQDTRISPSTLYAVENTEGSFRSAKDYTLLWGIISIEAGEEGNPHMIYLTPPSKNRAGKDEENGFSHLTIFEETFHAGQYLHNETRTSLSKEVEVRVALAYLGYQLSKNIIIIDEIKRMDRYVIKFYERSDVQSYFEKLLRKIAIPTEEEQRFRIAIKNMATDFYENYKKVVRGWEPEQTLESYNGATPYFDTLIQLMP